LSRAKLAATLMLAPLTGCVGVLGPQGPVGAAEKLILIDSVAIMLAIVAPTIIAILAFGWWFRAGNRRATYRPDWAFSGQLELLVWAVPLLVVTFLGGIAWFGSHALDPYKALPSPLKPVEVQVVSLDWKWLFLYPDAGIATVNELVIPVGVPVHFRLTSSGVMNSFFVPQLGSQIYTMAGMTTQLSLKADRAGLYPGLSAQFSGDGFADMHFQVRALDPGAYAQWVARTKQAGPTLDKAAYGVLARPTLNVRPGTYRAVQPGLFETIASGGVSATPRKGI
jgi:cytochrome o ubiquinol oxidase subunit 2